MWLLQQANRNLPPPSPSIPLHPPPSPFIPLHPPSSPFHPLHPLPPPPSTACSFHWLRANFRWARSAAGGVWQVCWDIGDDQHLTWAWSEVAYPGTPHTIHGGDDLRSWSFCVTVLCVWCWRTVEDTGVGLGLGPRLHWRVIFTEGKRSGNETVLDGTLVFIMLRLLHLSSIPSPFSFLLPLSFLPHV